MVLHTQTLHADTIYIPHIKINYLNFESDPRWEQCDLWHMKENKNCICSIAKPYGDDHAGSVRDGSIITEQVIQKRTAMIQLKIGFNDKLL
jgi:hypothetical protein